MQNLLNTLPTRAREAHAVNKKYFQKLAQKKPKKLDETVLDIHEEVFSEIDCLTCANCCKTTSPQADLSNLQFNLEKYGNLSCCA